MRQFRDESGRVIPDVNLCLSLSDFLQDNDVQENSRVSDPNLLISSGMIVKALEDEVEERETEKTSREEVKNRIKARKSNKRFSPLRIVSRWSGTLRKQKMVNYKPMMKR